MGSSSPTALPVGWGRAQRPRILVVDDDCPSCGVLAGMLQDEGFETAQAFDGLQAIERLRDFRPDLILSDLHMPGLDGRAMVERIRPSSPDLPVILMSADANVSPGEAAELGVQAFLSKPLSFDALLAEIASLLHLNEGHAPRA